jgi:cytochrome c peroxidase
MLDALDRQVLAAIDAAVPGGTAALVMPDSDDFGRIPQDPRNPVTAEKVKLGQLLFHEPGIMQAHVRREGFRRASCASCHSAGAGFQANRAQGIGEGGLGFGRSGEQRTLDGRYPPRDVDVQPIRTPTAMNGAFQPNMLWNGQFGATHDNVGTEGAWTPGTPKELNHLGFEGLETQAIAAQRVHRLIVTPEIASELGYRELFDRAFPEVPPGERYTRVTAGLAIAAYERTLLAQRSPWQRWLRGDRSAMSAAMKRGAGLFFGKANCGACHTGPALNKPGFAALGMADLTTHPDALVLDPDPAENKGRGGFTGRREDWYKFKIPQLYNLLDSPFYGHGASFTSVRAVLEYKNRAVPENMNVPLELLDPLFKPLGLSESEIDDLEQFVAYALYDPDLRRYEPSTVPSGQPFPVDDREAFHGRGPLGRVVRFQD